DGEPLPSGTLLLYAEQGFGDTLQFCRFITTAAIHAHRVIVEAPEPLLRLLRNIPNIAQVSTNADTADAACALPDLPHALNLSAAAIAASGAPYLSVPEDAQHIWAPRLETIASPRIGMAWRGRAETRPGTHLKRSLPLADLLAHLPAQASLFPLQIDITPDEATQLSDDPRVCDLTADIADFADTAALAAAMDVIVTIDTAPAHLALALGLPTWVLLPFSPDWRWGREPETTLWYPTARLFRQPAPGDWDAVLSQVKQALSLHLQHAAP
ncbi:MAG: O-linked N-acetylglucosamine transferase, partial [Rhodospirillaceae bacterium]|nr:O-linked N-acetylglucosamine transferase [Rhodospirillaceae bacterium]